MLGFSTSFWIILIGYRFGIPWYVLFAVSILASIIEILRSVEKPIEAPALTKANQESLEEKQAELNIKKFREAVVANYSVSSDRNRELDQMVKYAPKV